MDLSIVVVAHDMARELPRTIRTLSPLMQRDCRDLTSEVIVVENGSTHLADLSPYSDRMDLRTIIIPPEEASPSPVPALNAALAEARGDLIGVMIDGARMASPGLLHWAVRASRMDPRAVILSLGFHLGKKVQMESTLEGYDQAAEDSLLAGIPWEEDGYRLFDISVLAGSSRGGWFSEISESNAIFMPRALWQDVGGFDERYSSPGGGFVNLDLFERAITLEDIEIFTLLGEGTFHQCHGGAATNSTEPTLTAYSDEYRLIRGSTYKHPSYKSSYVGYLGNGARRFTAPYGSMYRQSLFGEARSRTRNQDADDRLNEGGEPKVEHTAGNATVTQPVAHHTSQEPFRPSALLIVGMHRSGTSALAGSLCELGYRLPGEPLPLAPDNPKGHFESVWVRSINERFLRRIGSGWDDPVPSEIDDWETLRIDDLVTMLDANIADAFRAAPFLVFKDPRLCVLAPIWVSALDRYERDVAFVFIGRAPLEVIQSLVERDGVTRAHAAMLWLKHVLSAERASRARPRCAITYEQLLDAPERTFASISDRLRCEWPEALESGCPRIEAFLEPGLRHHRSADLCLEDPLEALCAQTWTAFQSLTRDEADPAVRAEFDSIRDRVAEAGRLFASLLLQSGPMRATTAALAPHLNGMRIRAPSRPEVWLVINGRRHHIATAEVYDSLFSEVSGLQEMATVAHIERGPDLIDGTCLVQGERTPDIFLLKGSAVDGIRRHRIRSFDVFQKFAFDMTKVKLLPRLALAGIPEGSEID